MTDCPRRCVGCKINCPEWQEWLEVHEAEKTLIRDTKQKESEVDGFLIDQKIRIRQDSLRRSEHKNRRRKA